MYVDPVQSLFGGGFTSPLSPTNIPGSFSNVFDQAMSQAGSREEAAKIAWLRGQQLKQAVLFDMFSSPKSSAVGFGMTDLFATGGLFGLPSWVYDAERVLGADHPEIQSLLNASQQAVNTLQARFPSGLGSLGVGGNYESMF